MNYNININNNNYIILIIKISRAVTNIDNTQINV